MREYWLEYWWILPVLLYFFLLVVLIRRGKWKTAQKIALITTCVNILCIPAMRSPLNYVMAAAVVVYLLLTFRIVFKSEISSNPSNR